MDRSGHTFPVGTARERRLHRIFGAGRNRHQSQKLIDWEFEILDQVVDDFQGNISDFKTTTSLKIEFKKLEISFLRVQKVLRKISYSIYETNYPNGDELNKFLGQIHLELNYAFPERTTRIHDILDFYRNIAIGHIIEDSLLENQISFPFDEELNQSTLQ